MTVRELFALLDADPFDAAALPVVMLWHGEEEWSKEAALKKLIARCIPEGLEALNLNVFEENAAVSQVAAACETLPMMAPRRVVVARGLSVLCAPNPREDDAEHLAALIAGRGSKGDAVLILYCRGKADARRKAFQAVDAGNVVLFERPDEAQTARWLIRTARERNGEMEPAAADALVARAGCDLTLLAMELDKLLAYAYARPITVDDVALLVAPSLESSVFALADAVLERRPGEAWRALSDRLTQGDDPVRLLALLGSAIRQAHEARTLLDSSVREVDIAGMLGISSYAARHAIRRSRARSAAWWREAFLLALAAEEDIKSGSMDRGAALDGLLAKLMR